MGGPLNEDRKRILAHLEASIGVRKKMAESLADPLLKAAAMVRDALKTGGKLLFCGNGGSASDCQHLAAEFVGRYRMERRGQPAVALCSDTAVLTAIANDYGYDRLFARQVEALGRPGDVLFGLSTSGRSQNVIAAMKSARRLGLKTVAFTGEKESEMAGLADVVIRIPASEPAQIQEGHLFAGHMLCDLVESSFPAE